MDVAELALAVHRVIYVVSRSWSLPSIEYAPVYTTEKTPCSDARLEASRGRCSKLGESEDGG